MECSTEIKMSQRIFLRAILFWQSQHEKHKLSSLIKRNCDLITYFTKQIYRIDFWLYSFVNWINQLHFLIPQMAMPFWAFLKHWVIFRIIMTQSLPVGRRKDELKEEALFSLQNLTADSVSWNPKGNTESCACDTQLWVFCS